MTMSSAGPKHRAPTRWCRLEDEDEEQVTLAQLLDQNQRLLAAYHQRQYRRLHAGRPGASRWCPAAPGNGARPVSPRAAGCPVSRGAVTGPDHGAS